MRGMWSTIGKLNLGNLHDARNFCSDVSVYEVNGMLVCGVVRIFLQTLHYLESPKGEAKYK